MAKSNCMVVLELENLVKKAYQAIDIHKKEAKTAHNKLADVSLNFVLVKAQKEKAENDVIAKDLQVTEAIAAFNDLNLVYHGILDNINMLNFADNS